MRIWFLLRPKLALPLAAAMLLGTGCGDSDDDNSATGPGPNRSVDDASIPMVLSMVFNTIGLTVGMGEGTHQGSVSGEVVVSMANSKPALQNMQTNLAYNLLFKEYSNGQLYYDGEVNFRFSQSQQEGSEGFDSIYSTDNLQISGDYKAKIKMLLEIIGGEPSPESFYEVDGKRISLEEAGFFQDQ